MQRQSSFLLFLLIAFLLLPAVEQGGPESEWPRVPWQAQAQAQEAAGVTLPTFPVDVVPGVDLPATSKIDVNLNITGLDAEIDRAVDALKGVESTLEDFLPQAESLGKDVLKIADKVRENAESFYQDVIKAWQDTNDSFSTLADTFTSPTKMGLIAAGMASGAVLGSTFTHLLVKGVSLGIKSLFDFVKRKIDAPRVYDATLLHDFAQADKNYELSVRWTKILEKQLIRFMNLMKPIQRQSAKEEKKITQRDTVAFLGEVISRLQLYNERYQLQLEQWRPSLLDDPKGEYMACSLKNKKLIEKNSDKIRNLQEVKKLISEAPLIRPCHVIKDLYKNLVLAEENLEEYRIDLLAAQDLWQKKLEMDNLKEQEKVKRGQARFGQLEKDSVEASQKSYQTTKDNFIASIQIEVNTCMEQTTAAFKRKYPSGSIDWNAEFLQLENRIKQEYKFGTVKTTDEFTVWSWREKLQGKSWLRKYCEVSVYNQPYRDSEKGFTITRLDYFHEHLFKAQLLMNKKQEHFRKLHLWQSGQATMMVPTLDMSMDRQLAKSDRYYIRVTKDQLCYRSPDTCSDEETFLRITRAIKLKSKIEKICGPIVDF